MDFYKIISKTVKQGVIELYPDFIVGKSKDIMIRGGDFYCIWDEETNLWNKSIYKVQEIVDKALWEEYERLVDKTESKIIVKSMKSFSSYSWKQFKNYIKTLPDHYEDLDTKLIFSEDTPIKSDYASKKLHYTPSHGSIDAYEEIIDTIYNKEDRDKIEWSFGAILAGASTTIQKFLVFYGAAGTGKSTIIDISQQLFDGYYEPFNAKVLGNANNTHALEMFKSNPIVAIQHDGDLSKIEDNTVLNSIVSHEIQTIDEKHKPLYSIKVRSFLLLGSNNPVKITNSYSGIVRRLIDVTPTGNLITPVKFEMLKEQMSFELPHIAQHCIEKFNSMGRHYYTNYRAIDMMYKTDIFYNFVEDNYFDWKNADGITMTQAYSLYKKYCEESALQYRLPQHSFREELKSYFEKYSERTRVNGMQVRSYYQGFLYDKFQQAELGDDNIEDQQFIHMNESTSIFDSYAKDFPAQYANDDGTPKNKWINVKSILSEIDTAKLHYVRVPENHIVLDFDLKDSMGNKSLELNLKEASKFPATYSEISKSGQGVHLHYIYDGDVDQLSRIYSTNIEVKVYKGNASLRRMHTLSNGMQINHISTGLPLKEEKMIREDVVRNENTIRNLIIRNLNKEIHAATKPSMDFIAKILTDAYNEGIEYDVNDMRGKIRTFATESTNNAQYCLKLLQTLPFQSKEDEIEKIPVNVLANSLDDTIVFFDVEVFSNLFLICWKYHNVDMKPVRMFNPSPEDVASFIKMKLVGFNNRRYDNHILYARYLGYSNQELFRLSQNIIGKVENVLFREAYNLSYIDIYDYSSDKKSLAKWEVELRISHNELEVDWNLPLPEAKWDTAALYCDDDVYATEAVFKHTEADYTARLILAELSGLPANSSTGAHASRIIFGNDKNHKDEFVYPDLSQEFPGYTYDGYKSEYRGEDPGEGGYVYTEPGVYTNVALLDIASMHPSTGGALNVFGKYTKKWTELVQARLYIKHKEYDMLKDILGGLLVPFIKYDDEAFMNNLSFSLKIVVNIIYGFTSARFNNAFKDPRNVDNVVAKRGALFMINLKHECQARGYETIHIKTDSIKLANASQEAIDFVIEYGAKYGYSFELEATYDKLALLNKAVYVAEEQTDAGPIWEAIGKQFKIPYVFKTLFSKENITFWDLAETKQVKSAMYLVPKTSPEDKETFTFVGKVGSFIPVKEDFPFSFMLLRSAAENTKYDSVNGAKGYFWIQAHQLLEQFPELETMSLQDIEKLNIVDFNYYNNLVNDAVDDINNIDTDKIIFE